MRQGYVRPVPLAVTPSYATIPGYLGQLALSSGGFHVRAYPGEAAFPPPGARPPLAGNSGTPGKGPGGRRTQEQRRKYKP